VVPPRTRWINRNLAVGEKPPATPTKLHQEHHRHQDNRNSRTEAARRRSTERDDQKPKLNHQFCSSQDDAFSKGNDVASPPPSGARTRDFSHAAEWWCRVVLQRGLQEGERRRWCRPRHGQQRRPWVSTVPAVQHLHHPTCPTPRSSGRRPQELKKTGGRADQAASPSDLETGPAPHTPSTTPTPPARPRERGACTTAAARRRADAIHAARGRRPGVPGPSRSRRWPHPQPPPAIAECRHSRDGEGDGKEEAVENDRRLAETSSPRSRLPPYCLAGSSVR
jgi:hypothetical protein